jgi:hypothetical protein
MAPGFLLLASVGESAIERRLSNAPLKAKPTWRSIAPPPTAPSRTASRRFRKCGTDKRLLRSPRSLSLPSKICTGAWTKMGQRRRRTTGGSCERFVSSRHRSIEKTSRLRLVLETLTRPPAAPLMQILDFRERAGRHRGALLGVPISAFSRGPRPYRARLGGDPHPACSRGCSAEPLRGCDIACPRAALVTA